MQYRLVATDMDGTLLNDEHAIPEEFWPVLSQLHTRGIQFAPASGRQIYTLLRQFDRLDPDSFSAIAENGALVFHNGAVVSTTPVNPVSVHTIVDVVDSHPEINWGIVLCRVDGAYICRTDDAFVAESDRYYARLNSVSGSLHPYVDDSVLKIAIFCFDDAETIGAPLLRGRVDDLTVTVSGQHWIDMMNPEVNKGRALEQLAATMNIPLSETVAFGDYLNDLELITTAGTSYAMANGHPDIIAAADHTAPANTDNGVVRVLTALLAEQTPQPAR